MGRKGWKGLVSISHCPLSIDEDSAEGPSVCRVAEEPTTAMGRTCAGMSDSTTKNKRHLAFLRAEGLGLRQSHESDV